MEKINIIADDKIPYLKGVLEPYATINYLPGNKISNADLKNVDALLIRTRTKCDATLLKGTKVKFIATATIGFDHIDTSFCEANNIYWTNAPGCNSSSVKQYIASVITTLLIRHNLTFNNLTLGVIGVGNVGKKIVHLAEQLGIKVLQNDPPRELIENENFVTLNEIIEQCNIITCHVPLIMEGQFKTYHLFDEHKLNQLKPDTILINSSRGEVVNNNALKQLLKDKKIKGAVLDVWENEPEIDLELLSLLDIATPHIAGYSYDGKANGTAMSVDALCNYFKIPLKSWYPKELEMPNNSLLNVSEVETNKELFYYEIFNSIYTLAFDDDRLRKKPEEFEKQRGDYPLRRESVAYTIKNKNYTKTTIKSLLNLGFKLA